jgi:hypothetical protein
MKICIYIDGERADQRYNTTIKMLKVDLLLAKHELEFIDLSKVKNNEWNDEAEKHADVYIIAPGGLAATAKFYQHLNLKDHWGCSKQLILYNFDGDFDRTVTYMDTWCDIHGMGFQEVKQWYIVARTAEDIIAALK